MKEILDRVKEFEPVYRDYLLSGDIEKITAGFAEFHGFDKITAGALENGVYLFMTFFIDKNGLTKFIKENTDLNSTDSAFLTEAIILSIPTPIRALQQRTSLLVFAETESTTTGSNQFTASNQTPPPPAPQK